MAGSQQLVQGDVDVAGRPVPEFSRNLPEMAEVRSEFMALALTLPLFLSFRLGTDDSFGRARTT